MTADLPIHHVPVLLDEVVRSLPLLPHGRYIDATLGLGGHASAILDASSPDGRLLGVDRDPEALARAAQRLRHFGARVELALGRFSQLLEIAAVHAMVPVDGVVADLGMSSLQLEDAARGFSFQRNGPLDMRMGEGPTLAERLATADVSSLTLVLKEFGEVVQPRRVATAILKARDEGALESTRDLVRVLEHRMGPRHAADRIHPATRVFQALRLWVNEELSEIKSLMSALPKLLRAGGRAAVITFHSLEDRIVKHAFGASPVQPVRRGLWIDDVSSAPMFLVSKKAATPSPDEIFQNPRARSAKLRVFEKRGA